MRLLRCRLPYIYCLDNFRRWRTTMKRLLISMGHGDVENYISDGKAFDYNSYFIQLPVFLE